MEKMLTKFQYLNIKACSFLKLKLTIREQHCIDSNKNDKNLRVTVDVLKLKMHSLILLTIRQMQLQFLGKGMYLESAYFKLL